ncbi:DEAD/DEAH box helicase [Coraliomargarita parva]|uniref:DEAD/DEAH box helicase n=1 Tax=Coraliomargarita parva TaxID=3014050 RepID=UPI0022B2FFB2|nr:AAA domain-containing protein [Coraliomargarita parva]
MHQQSPNREISTDDLREQLLSLSEFTAAEFAAQRSGYLKLWKMPLEKRIAEGLCIAGLNFERRTTEGQYRFRYRENETDFREGDFLRLSTGDPMEPLTECVLVAEDPPFVTLDISRKDFNLGASGDLYLDASYFDLENIVMQGIDEIGTTIRGRERILPLLLGNMIEDEVDQEAYDTAWTESEGAGYNNSQSDAIAAGSASQWCSLVQGPPGTGKTQVLANIVVQRLARRERILITAFTHRAIHQALRTIKKILPNEDRIVKIGTHIPDPDLPVSQYESFAESPLADMTGGYVVGATVFATRSFRLKGIDFDALIIDEASQMTLPYAVLGMLTSDCYIIIGDPQQLPPVIQSCGSSEAHEYSIFKTLQRNNDLTLLDTTYRMNAVIAEWSSNQYYNGQLSSHSSAANRKLQLHFQPEADWLQHALSPDAPLTWLEHTERGCRKLCMEEVDLVNQLLGALLSSGLSANEVAVVTPYRKQARAIRQRLKQSSSQASSMLSEVVIDTVERMQGQEREVIIISCVSNEPSFIRAVAEFLFLPSRLNVAVTRARSKVILIASDSLLDVDSMQNQVEEALMVWQNLKASAEVIRV